MRAQGAGFIRAWVIRYLNLLLPLPNTLKLLRVFIITIVMADAACPVLKGEQCILQRWIGVRPPRSTGPPGAREGTRGSGHTYRPGGRRVAR